MTAVDLHVTGAVLHGFKRGRELGFPTANIALPEGAEVPFGVYAAKVSVADGPHAGDHLGCASVGVRPTFKGETANLEVFLLDFDGDLYDAEVDVHLLLHLRPELKFDQIDDLVAQMHQDIADTRAYFRSNP